MHFGFKAFSFLIVFSLLLYSCGSGSFYEKTYSLDSGNWTYADSLDFSFQIADTTGIYNLWLEVEHSTAYPYQNLYTKIHTLFPSGQQLHEPLSLELADKVGRWYGDCNSRSCTLRIPIQQGAFFDQAGDYKITLEQFMRQDPISGVQRIGFIVEATGQTRQE
jgi:gliding motility-associated lipoprotein GldH